MNKWSWGDVMILVGIMLMIGGLRVKLAENLNEKNTTIVKQEQIKVEVININSATVRELVDLPSIGDKMAQRIIDYRLMIGKFKTKEQLKDVSGIGNKTYESIKNKISI